MQINSVLTTALAQIGIDGYTPKLVVFDRLSVVDFWRTYGLTCMQCAPDELWGPSVRLQDLACGTRACVLHASELKEA